MTPEQHEPGRTIVRNPEKSGGKGTAGLAVSYDPDARQGEKVTVEQLWPPTGDEDTGRAEPVYVGEDDIYALIHELMGVHMALMEDDNGI